jgi:hypothetical protein
MNTDLTAENAENTKIFYHEIGFPSPPQNGCPNQAVRWRETWSQSTRMRGISKRREKFPVPILGFIRLFVCLVYFVVYISGSGFALFALFAVYQAVFNHSFSRRNLMKAEWIWMDADFGRSAIVSSGAHKCSGKCSDKPNHLRSDH